MAPVGQILRRAVADDLAAIQQCARAAYSQYVERIGRDPAPMVADFASQIRKGQVYVVVSEVVDSAGSAGQLHGYVVFYPRDDHLHLENVAVDPQFHGHGIGTRLISFVEEEARRGGYRAIELYTNAKMTENLVLYPKAGFVQTGRQTEDGFDRVYFRKALSQ